jgi:hypothetical protein
MHHFFVYENVVGWKVHCSVSRFRYLISGLRFRWWFARQQQRQHQARPLVVSEVAEGTDSLIIPFADLEGIQDNMALLEQCYARAESILTPSYYPNQATNPIQKLVCFFFAEIFEFN